MLLNKKRKTIGRSFRIDEEWLNVLKEEGFYMTVNVPFLPVESCNTFLKDLA